MRKWLLAVITVLFAAVLTVTTGITEASAATKTGTTSDGFSYKISKDNTVEITKYKGKEKKLVFPDKIKGKKVTRIGKAAVKGNKYVSLIEVPDSVKVVSVDAFDDCKNLTTIKLGKNVEKICAEKDENFTYLFGNDATHMKLGKKFKAFEVSYGNKIFYAKDGVLFQKGELYSPYSVSLVKCPPTKKGDYRVPDGIDWVNLAAFEGSQLSSVSFSAEIESITGINESNIAEYKVDEENKNYYSKNGILFEKYNQFYNEKDVLVHYPPEKRDDTYQVPQETTVIEREAFTGHKYLKEVDVGTAAVMPYAFAGCKKLKRVVTSGELCDGAFLGCEKLTDVEIGNIEEIGEYAFTGCGLHSLVLPESVKEVGFRALEDCNSLKWAEIRNKDCDISGCLYIGKINKTVIYGYPGSTAEKLARKSGQEFRLIGEDRPEEHNPGTITRETVKLSETSFVYDGKEKKPKVTVKDKFANKVDKFEYKVSYKNNKNVGEAIVKIQFKSSSRYTGTIQTTFVIKSPKSRITKLISGKNDITLQWSGVKASQISGYEIQYSTSDKFETENTQTLQINKRDAVKKQIKNLESKKTYYVRIRSYKNIKREGKPERLYSKWSDKKKVKTS